MTARPWYLAGAIGLPLLTVTVYLVWIWPQPRGTSAWAELGPYFLSVLTGLPFAWPLSHGPGRIAMLLAFVIGAFVMLWIYAALVLCGVRGVCL